MKQISKPTVTVFGSARPLPGEPAYEEAFLLGHSLARASYQVASGGYMGTMEAVSKGCHEAGGVVIGVTCAEIEAWRPVPPNAWIDELIPCQTLEERIRTLITCGNTALIALPGGIGSLAEILMVWNHILLLPTDSRPFLLIGDGWKETLQTFYRTQQPYVPDSFPPNFHFISNISSVFQIL